MRKIPLALGAAALLATANTALSNETAFLERFEGSFTGSGNILRDVDPEPRRISCRLAGSLQTETRLSISGSCRAAVIFTRDIGADIQLDPSSGTFSGVYTGSTSGPARLSNGRLEGDTMTLDVTYGAPIYGDSDAVMVITNAGGGSFTMTVTDQIEGTATQTSQITLSRA